LSDVERTRQIEDLGGDATHRRIEEAKGEKCDLEGCPDAEHLKTPRARRGTPRTLAKRGLPEKPLLAPMGVSGLDPREIMRRDGWHKLQSR
jgi:hypothetical protein